jgi:hypothetical protein
VLLYPVFKPKPSTHHMCAHDHLFHTHRPKVFIDNQMSRIEYIYYIDIVNQRLNNSREADQQKAPNTTGIATKVMQV